MSVGMLLALLPELLPLLDPELPLLLPLLLPLPLELPPGPPSSPPMGLPVPVDDPLEQPVPFATVASSSPKTPNAFMNFTAVPPMRPLGENGAVSAAQERCQRVSLNITLRSRKPWWFSTRSWSVKSRKHANTQRRRAPSAERRNEHAVGVAHVARVLDVEIDAIEVVPLELEPLPHLDAEQRTSHLREPGREALRARTCATTQLS
jgi:hypothetical protein